MKKSIFLAVAISSLSIGLDAATYDDEWVTKREWPYLTSEALKTRYALTAYLLRDSQVLVEVGGYKTPISGFVDNKTVIVIDPKIEAMSEPQKIHLPIKLQDWNEQEIQGVDYSLVILGMDLHLDDSGWEKLFNLINNSKKTIIEFSSSYKPARKQFTHILDHVTKNSTLVVKLDLSDNDGSSYPEFYPYREIYSLE